MNIPLPAKLVRHLQQPGALPTSSAERHFIAAVHAARAGDVGFGWMSQVIEWIWQETAPGAFGPEYYETRIAELERKHAQRATPYTGAKPLLKAAMEGAAAALRKEFPPCNPYSPSGLIAGEEDTMPEAAAWFFGFWDVMYDRSGLKQFKKGAT